jgi:hypothetical protein
MKASAKILFMLLTGVLFFCQACKTLYNPSVINIEIVEPAKVRLPDNYRNLAVRYNNVNIARNPRTSVYIVDGDSITDPSNLDSIASEVYFDLFVATLEEQQFFHSITRIEAADYSHTQIVDTLTMPQIDFTDSSLTSEAITRMLGAHILAAEIKKTNPSPVSIKNKKYLDSDFGLYSKEEISEIADSCAADMLLSLDHFYTQNGIYYLNYNSTAHELVEIHYSWTAYDLNKKKLAFHFSKADTIYWSHSSTSKKEALRQLPPRKDAVLNAADIAGSNTAKFLIPHWATVQRIYFQSGAPETKPANELAKEGKWLEAAEIWKKHANNKNKNLAAKCTFNMALACEFNDQLDAALEWVVESYHIFGEKNEIHAANCRDYIRILAQRKRDRSILEKQYYTDK